MNIFDFRNIGRVEQGRLAGIVFLLAIFLMAQHTRAAESGRKDDGTVASPLVRAVRLGQVEAVRGLLAEKADVDESGPSGWTPLMHALSVGQTEIAGLLLDAGADVKRADWFGRSVLWYACRSGDASLVRRMIRMGAPVDPRIPWNREDVVTKSALSAEDAYPPAEAAIRRDDADVLEELLAGGLDPQRLSFDAMLWAGRHGSPETIRCLQRRGLDPNGLGRPGTTPLIAAACRGNIENVKTLLELGADPNRTGSPVGDEFFSGSFQGPTPLVSPLLAAVFDYRTDTAEILIRAGADVTVHDNLPIKFADRYGDEKMYALLRKAGAPEPEPYALGKPVFFGKAQKEQNTARSDPGRSAVALSQSAPAEEPAPLPEGKDLRCAVVSGEGLEDFETVLTAALSGVKGIAVLERSALRQIGKERELARSGGASIPENREAGRLLGADALIFLEKVPWEGKSFLQTTVVAAGTGVVLERFLAPAARSEAADWSENVRRRVVAAGPKLLAPAAEAIYLSIPHFSSPGAYGSSRELARQMEILLRSRLGANRRIFFLEREEMTRLALEKNASGNETDFATSAWLLEGNLEVPIDEAEKEVSLRMKLRAARGGEEREVKLEGTRDKLIELAGESAGRILKFLEQEESVAWDREAEARAWGEAARWNFRNGFLPAAIAAADAAEALGLESDENRRIGIQSRGALLARAFHQVHRGPPVDFWFTAWAARDEPEVKPQFALTPEKMINLALEMVGDEKGFISCLQDKDGGKQWISMGGALRDATLPLVLLQSISARNEFATELALLRGRLVRLNDALLSHATEKGNKVLYRQMLSARCRLAPWWFESSAADEMRRIYREEGQDIGSSEEALFASCIFQMASRGYPMDIFPYPARHRMMWKKLAEDLMASGHTGERFLGASILACGRFSLRDFDRAAREALALYPAIFARETGQPAPGEYSVNRKGYAAVAESLAQPGSGKMADDFYSAHSQAERRQSSWAAHQTMLPDDSADRADLIIGRLDRLTFLLAEDPPVVPPMFETDLPFDSERKFEPTDAERIQAALRRCRAAFETGFPDGAAKKQCETLTRLDERLGPKPASKSEYVMNSGPYHVDLTQARFVGAQPASDSFIAASGFVEPPAYFDGKLWSLLDDWGADAPFLLSEYDPKSGQVTLRPGSSAIYRPLLIDELFIVASHIYERAVVIDVFDRKRGTWERRELLKNAKPGRNLLVKGKLVILFDEAGADSHGGQAQGILVHDLKTRKTELVASTSRKPSQGPLDFAKGGRHFSKILHDGENRVYVANDADGRPVAFDVTTGAWEGIPVEKFTSFKEPERANVVMIDGIPFRFGKSLKDGKWLEVSSSSKGRTFSFAFRMNYDFSTDESALKAYPRQYKQYLYDRENPRFQVHAVPSGLYLRGQSGFFFITKDQLREPLLEALEGAER